MQEDEIRGSADHHDFENPVPHEFLQSVRSLNMKNNFDQNIVAVMEKTTMHSDT